MKIRTFRSVRFHNDFEINFIGKVWNFRFGRSQISLWKNSQSIFSWFKKIKDSKAWHDPIGHF